MDELVCRGEYLADLVGRWPRQMAFAAETGRGEWVSL